MIDWRNGFIAGFIVASGCLFLGYSFASTAYQGSNPINKIERSR